MTTPVVTPARAAAPSASWGAGGVPWFVWAAVVAATSAKVGILWDISWHCSIGRDTFWPPAHVILSRGVGNVQLGARSMGHSAHYRAPRRKPSSARGLLGTYVVAILLHSGTTVAIEQLGFPHDAYNALHC